MTLPAQDIVERLRYVTSEEVISTAANHDIHEAADTISRLTADNEALREENRRYEITCRGAVLENAKMRARADALAQEVERLKAALAEAGESLDWAARRMKGNCSGSEVNAVMLAAGRTADARAALGDRP